MNVRRAVVWAATVVCALSIASEPASAGVAGGAPLTLPFDFSQEVIGLQVSLHGAPLFALLDTGVDPSTIDLARAKALGLKIETGEGGKGSGFGEGAAPTVFPTCIVDLSAGGRSMRAFDALATGLSAISRSFGHPVDAVSVTMVHRIRSRSCRTRSRRPCPASRYLIIL